MFSVSKPAYPLPNPAPELILQHPHYVLFWNHNCLTEEKISKDIVLVIVE